MASLNFSFRMSCRARLVSAKLRSKLSYLMDYYEKLKLLSSLCLKVALENPPTVFLFSIMLSKDPYLLWSCRGPPLPLELTFSETMIELALFYSSFLYLSDNFLIWSPSFESYSAKTFYLSKCFFIRYCYLISSLRLLLLSLGFESYGKYEMVEL